MEDIEAWRSRYLLFLKDRLNQFEFQRICLTAEIDSPKTSSERRTDARRERDRALIDWGFAMTALADQYRSYKPDCDASCDIAS